MNILFVCSSKSGFSSRLSSPAAVHRTLQLEHHCKMLGVSTSLLFLGDLFFSSPVLIQILNIPILLRYLKSFDVVVSEAYGPAYVLAIAKPLLGKGVLLVYDVHSDTLTESRLVKKGRFDLAGHFTAFEMRLMEYVGFNGIDYFSTASERLKQRIVGRNRNIKDEYVEVILNGVNLKSFGPKRKIVNHACGNSFTVTYAGSFSKYQGIENLVKAAEILNSENIHFKLIGFCEEDFAFKKEIQARLKDKVTLINWLPRDELLTELQESNILIIPAESGSQEQRENRIIAFPTKFAEYLALAKPVIVTRIDETSNIVERFDCGFVCEPTARSLAATILTAKETSMEMLYLKGANGRRFVETQLDEKLISKHFLEFLKRMIQRRQTQKV
jgi:glycosyltransferase involved in cell wall biosynthesis